jgi:hypothetical protein
MNDLSLLFKLDKIISSFFESLPSFDHEAPSELKKLVRAWHSIVHNDYTYLSNYDEIDTVRKKRGLLVKRGNIAPESNPSDQEIENLFRKYLKKQIRRLERDEGYNYIATG